MEQDKDSFFTKQFDNWEHLRKNLKIGALIIISQ
jgi:hypothetical protein